MSKIIKGIKDGSVTILAFKKVREGYRHEKQTLDRLDPLNHDRLNDLNMSISFCDNFLNYYESIKVSKKLSDR